MSKPPHTYMKTKERGKIAADAKNSKEKTGTRDDGRAETNFDKVLQKHRMNQISRLQGMISEYERARRDPDILLEKTAFGNMLRLLEQAHDFSEQIISAGRNIQKSDQQVATIIQNSSKYNSKFSSARPTSIEVVSTLIPFALAVLRTVMAYSKKHKP